MRKFGKERWARRAHGWDRHGGGHHGMHGWGGGRGRHGGGMRRMFDQADLRLVVLALIAEQPRHGYDIIKDIEARFGGGYAPSPGVIYPLLTMLEEQGVVSMSAGEGSKKLYTITPDGEADLASNKATVDAVFARINAVRERFSNERPAEVLRAFENLKFALRLRTERGVDEAQARAIAAALDAAAQAVERS